MSKQTDAMRLYFEEKGILQVDVAKAMNVSPSRINNILAGREGLGKRNARKFSDLYGFNYVYLVTGEGSLFAPVPPVSQNMHAGINNGTMSQSAAPSPDHEERHRNGCPSIDELLARVDELSKSVEAKDREISWLREIVNRLMPDAK